MIPYLGDFVEDDVVYMMFNTFSSDDPSASCTITNFINTDVHIHKDDSTTQRNNAAGITVSVNFDGITGSHLIKIDTNDNTVAGFWVTGHDYFVRIEGTTIDGATINAVVGHFSIQNRFMRGTNSAALATGVNVTQISGDTTAANNLESYCDGTTPQPVNITQLGGVVQSLTDLKDFADAGYDPATNKIEGCKVNDDMVGTNGANTTTPPTVGAIRTEMEGAGTKLLAIETDTNALQTDWADGGRLDLLMDRLLNVVEVRHGLSVNDAAASTTKFITTMTEGAGFPWDRAAVLFTSGANSGLMRRIKAYNGTTKEITVQTPLHAAPADNDTFVMPAIRAFLTPDIEDIADQVLEEPTADHPTAGSLSKAIIDILADTDNLQSNQGDWATATSVTVSDKTGFALSAAGVDAILDENIEGTHSMREMMRLFASMLVGKVSGGGTTTITFRDIDDSKNRIVMTVTDVGNRTGVVLTES